MMLQVHFHTKPCVNDRNENESSEQTNQNAHMYINLLPERDSKTLG